MIRSFRDKDTEALFAGARCHPKWQAFARVALRKLTMVHAAKALEDLNCPPGNRLEALKGDRAGQHSIRVNGQYRVCFVWRDGGVDNVEIVDYH
jgi:proteic killer suppression protein